MKDYENEFCNSCTRSCKQSSQAIVLACAKYDYNGMALPPCPPEPKEPRELTATEKQGIKTLVTSMCANYDKYYNVCALLDGACYMLTKHYNDNKLCTYFKNAVLPLDKVLEIYLTDTQGDAKRCSLCHSLFIPHGRQAYCSNKCRAEAKRKSDREWRRKRRQFRG